MSKFLTPPVWYDKNGELNDMLTGEAFMYGIAIGNSAAAAMYGVAVGYSSSGQNAGVAVGYSSNATTEGVAVGYSSSAEMGGVAIGSDADASSGGIAIGQNAHAESSNIIQLGDSAETFDLNVGDGSGTLRIGDIAFRKMTISNNRVSIESPGVYLCCTTTGPAVSASSDVAIFFINDINNIASVLSSTAGSCSYENSNHVIKPGTNYTIKYCFKIISF